MPKSTAPLAPDSPTKTSPLKTLAPIEPDSIQDLVGARSAIGLLFNLVED